MQGIFGVSAVARRAGKTAAVRCITVFQATAAPRANPCASGAPSALPGAAAYGYGGRTQEFHFIAGRLKAAA